MNVLFSFCWALFLTIVIEMVVACAIYFFSHIKMEKHDVISIVLAQVMTNPLLNVIVYFFVWPMFGAAGYVVILFLELVVCVVEALWYKKSELQVNVWLLSFLTNAVSYGIGLFL